uniref:Uncharacterized protein n=1 Tax=Oryza meridionalis TaxID=40149 RepID=A0A0E0C468_9ORYZ
MSSMSSRMKAMVTSILFFHPGPFSIICLICSSMGSHDDMLRSWFRAFADKHLEELAFLNPHYPNDVMLPNTGIVPCTHTFRELREICLHCCILHEWDVKNLLTCSPKVEKLLLIGSSCGWLLRLDDLVLVFTPCLECLILWKDDALYWRDSKKIKICSTLKLQSEHTNMVNLEFWKEVGFIQCVRSSINKVIFDDFSGDECELALLTFVAHNTTNQLEQIYIIPSKKDPNFYREFFGECHKSFTIIDIICLLHIAGYKFVQHKVL